jgi:hypothetical protein
MKKRALIIIALVLVVLAFVVSRPPRVWSSITAGMSRQDVYTRLGQPAAISDERKVGYVIWQRDLLVGRWEFFTTFSSDSVYKCGHYWRWNW